MAEAQKLGFSDCILPKVSITPAMEETGVRLHGVSGVQEAIDLI